MVIGEIARPHGVRGEVRVTPLTDHPERFARVGACVLWDAARDEREPCRVATARRHGDAVIVALEGCDSPEAAGALVGRLLAVPEAEAEPLAPGRFYPWQLEGARVVTEDGTEIGRVTGIEQSAAQDWWVVRGGVREHLIPAVPEIVLDVDLAAARVVIRPPDGLLDL
ncbi:MAG: 16S rRNA processing protein RimM [Candidatus Rokubacteria bacterium]|nr:16S rRNA processing protein RimM [Candidatus Rokubacteria bacterium]MBI3824630.1 16S rRNA processing protein RimM [Candidatus Rokubacteria bacterium]